MVSANNSINDTVGASISGVTNTLTITNPSNTASSQAKELITVGGATAGDPWINWNVSGVTDWSMGIDNGDSDHLKISQASTIGTTDTWIMTTAGERTMPLQPAFRAIAEIGSNTNVTGNGTTYQIKFNSEVFDQNNDFDPTTYLFTAPVDGIYLFSCIMKLSGITSSHVTGRLETRKNGSLNTRLMEGSPAAMRSSSNTVDWNGCSVVNLTAGDTIDATMYVGGGTKVIDLEGFLMGFLVC